MTVQVPARAAKLKWSQNSLDEHGIADTQEHRTICDLLDHFARALYTKDSASAIAPLAEMLLLSIPPSEAALSPKGDVC
jgi:hypothetical protein